MAGWNDDNVLANLAATCSIGGLDGVQRACGVCGHALTYGHVLLNLDTLEGVVVGSDCLATYEQVHAGTMSAVYAERRALEQRLAAGRIERAMAILIKPRMTDDIFALVQSSNHAIVADILTRAAKYQAISDNQLALLADIVTQEAARAAAQAEADVVRAAAIAAGVSLTTGTANVIGTVLAVMAKEGYYGTTYKAIVQDNSGFKVYVTQFQAKRYVTDEAGAQLEKKTGRLFVKQAIEVGDHVSFTCEVETISERDELFGFAKRPTKGVILQTEAA
jgi:hypothetical protein